MTFDSYMRKGALSYDVRGDGRGGCRMGKRGVADGKLGEWLTTCANRMTDGTRARGSNGRTRTHAR